MSSPCTVCGHTNVFYSLKRVQVPQRSIMYKVNFLAIREPGYQVHFSLKAWARSIRAIAVGHCSCQFVCSTVQQFSEHCSSGSVYTCATICDADVSTWWSSSTQCGSLADNVVCTSCYSYNERMSWSFDDLCHLTVICMSKHKHPMIWDML